MRASSCLASCARNEAYLAVRRIKCWVPKLSRDCRVEKWLMIDLAKSSCEYHGLLERLMNNSLLVNRTTGSDAPFRIATFGGSPRQRESMFLYVISRSRYLNTDWTWQNYQRCCVTPYWRSDCIQRLGMSQWKPYSMSESVTTPSSKPSPSRPMSASSMQALPCLNSQSGGRSLKRQFIITFSGSVRASKILIAFGPASPSMNYFGWTLCAVTHCIAGAVT